MCVRHCQHLQSVTSFTRSRRPTRAAGRIRAHRRRAGILNDKSTWGKKRKKTPAASHVKLREVERGPGLAREYIIDCQHIVYTEGWTRHSERPAWEGLKGRGKRQWDIITQRHLSPEIIHSVCLKCAVPRPTGVEYKTGIIWPRYKSFRQSETGRMLGACSCGNLAGLACLGIHGPHARPATPGQHWIHKGSSGIDLPQGVCILYRPMISHALDCLSSRPSPLVFLAGGQACIVAWHRLEVDMVDYPLPSHP